MTETVGVARSDVFFLLEPVIFSIDNILLI